MHVVLQIAAGWLGLNTPDVGLAERRPVTVADQERLRAGSLRQMRLQSPYSTQVIDAIIEYC